MPRSLLLAVLACSFGTGLAAGAEPSAQELDFFERRVRPLLTTQCISCHGPKKQESGLRLDSRAALLKGGKHGPAIKPGDADNSLLIQTVRYAGKIQMPPKGQLKAERVDVLTAWVTMGAPWPEGGTTGDADAWKHHWAFQPVTRPAIPDVKDRDWPRNDLDRFVLAKLEAKGLSPSPPAERRTLIRRVTFDLTGLPPTPEEVEAFIRDPSADAYEKVVDRLLASPRYGERWGRYWLDVARYADTKGYVFFEEKEYPWAYTYRDYVVRSLNDDLPYDRFLLEQLAADRLALGADKRPLTALGFLTLGGHFMNNPHDILDDRIDVVCRGLLGLTVTCARCHDHKFDPISQKDYYALYGVFASCAEPAVPPLFAEPPTTEAYTAFAKELQAREKKLNEFLQAKYAEVVNGAKTRTAAYLLAARALRDQPNPDDFMLLADGSDLNPTMVARWRAYLERTRKTQHPVFAAWHAFADLPEKEFADRAPAVCVQLNADAAGPINPLVARAFADKPPRTLAEVAERYAALLNDPAHEELRRVFSEPDSPPNVSLTQLGELALLPDRPAQAKLQELRKAVEQWRATGPGAPPRAMALADLPVAYEPHVFLRGNPNNLGEAVPRRFVAVLAGEHPSPFTQGSGRLELAQAIASKDNPLTARVLVNRVWLHHFGQGLVRTPSDFGLRSEPPSHPELLDYLATFFVEKRWSLKKLQREILLSATYRQRGDDRPEGRRLDPENALLWKMNRHRLDFEATRDTLLAVSGRLEQALGGPPAQDLLGASANRRTLYGFLDRLNLPGLYRTFDFPSPDATSPQRDTTTVAPQALFLMNNPFVLDCAQRLVRRPDVAGEADTPRRVGRLYAVLFGRPPTEDEVRLAKEFLQGERDAAVGWQRYAQALLLVNEFVFVD